MNIKIQKNNLIDLLEKMLKGEVYVDELSDYAWEVIDCFSAYKNEKNLPFQLDDDERSFWYAVWKIQHLADDEHYENNGCRADLLETLEHLRAGKLPKGKTANRP